MVLNQGRSNDQQVVPANWITDILYNGNNAAWKPTMYSSIWPNGFYRDQWYVTKDNHNSFFAVGVNGQNIWVNPTNQVVIVKLSSFPISAHHESATLTWAGMDAIARHLGSPD